MNCVITSVFLTVLCVALMMHNDGFEAYYLFTFSDIHKCKMLGRRAKLLIIYVYIYIYIYIYKTDGCRTAFFKNCHSELHGSPTVRSADGVNSQTV